MHRYSVASGRYHGMGCHASDIYLPNEAARLVFTVFSLLSSFQDAEDFGGGNPDGTHPLDQEYREVRHG